MEKPHKQLDVWQQGMVLVEMVYQLTSTFPVDERFGLSGQMRRAAVSIPSNIAEGAARATTRDYLHFLVMARGSLSELDTQLELSVRLNFLLPEHPVFALLASCGRLLSALINRLRYKLKNDQSGPA